MGVTHVSRLAIIFVGVVLSAVVGHSAEIKEGKQPIQITSDSLEAFNEKRMVVFSGNAVAVRGDMVLRSDKLIIYYKKAAEPSKTKEGKGIEKSGDLDRLEAKGHVTVTQGTRVATGAEAVFEQDTQRIIMTGNPVLREDKNIVRGNKITLLLDENRGVVESDKGKRVTAVIFPSDKPDKKDIKK